MSTLCARKIRFGWLVLLLTGAILALGPTEKLQAQVIDAGIQRAVGGVSIDASGLLDTAQLDALGELAKVRVAAMGKAPNGLNLPAEMRKISLRGLDEAIAQWVKNHKDNEPLPNEIRYLAGLQQIQYVFVYPEEKDIVLAGFGEGWKVDAQGNVVGQTTGRPVLQLDDLLTALRTALPAAQAGGIRCSIDPTQEGIAKLNELTATNPQAPLKAREQAMGMQQITLAGVPGSSHFARVLVAADYRMKRIGMGFEPAPKGVKLPSYLQLLSMTSHSVSTPRWWMEPKVEAILKDPNNMAWEIRGLSVQTLSQEDFFNEKGEKVSTGGTNQLAKQWADTMTKQYASLAVGDPIFGELQNCMGLAVVGALIVRERLPERAGNTMPTLFSTTELRTDEYYVPKQVASQASLLRKAGRGSAVSVSGGVAINAWSMTEKAQVSDSVAAVRGKAMAKDRTAWWWN